MLLNQESNGPPKPDEAMPVEEVNGVSLEDNTAALQAEPASEEVPQPPGPDVGMLMALSQPMEDLSITYPLEFERYWRATQENPLDFTAWTELLQYVEQEVGACPKL